ncbi:MAG: phosphoenolpyruvate carboxykinase (ATP) [Parcubacteria group bacterium]|nr:phosphoenolpyruvate carboxykinase (ATP) [Parcubacteria group bacterium]
MNGCTIPSRLPNESISSLVRHALMREQAKLSKDGALCVCTGARTGRSPNDRYIVANRSIADSINWNAFNTPYDPEQFELRWEEALAYARTLPPLFHSNDLWIGTHPTFRIPLNVYTEYAWHQMFARTTIPKSRTHDTNDKPVTLLNLPSFTTDPKRHGTRSDAALWLDLAGRRILALGLNYAGEIKKAGFTFANYELPRKGVLTMHCSVVVTGTGKVVWMFGLSGTGKTTHATSDNFRMVGDDMFSYSPDGVTAQLEDGCYPSVIKLSPTNEPAIYSAVNRSGALLENVVLHRGVPDFDDGRFTQNTRAAYPLSHIENRTAEVNVGRPDYVIFLTCDANGILPPLSILRSREQILYHYLSGYTSKIGRTVVGSVKGVSPTFSSFFGEDFYPGHSALYADLFEKMLLDCKPTVALVNTGYTGGSADGGGRRFDIPTSRRIINAVVDGHIAAEDCNVCMPEINLFIPPQASYMEDEERDPRIAFRNKPEDFTARTNELQAAFAANWDKKFPTLDRATRDAGLPRP